MAEDKNNIFSVRMEQEDKEKLLEMIQESGKNNKEFMNVLVSAYELNRAKTEIPEIAKDIEGLEALTQRINDYYVNIGKRIVDTQKSKDILYTKDMEIFKNRIEALKAENEKVNAELEGLKEAYNSTCEDNEELKKQIKQLTQIQESNSALIEEYRGKIDTLSGIIEEYKGYKAENETVKGLLADAQAKSVNQENSINKLNGEIENLNGSISALKEENKKAIADLNNKHIEELKASGEKAAIEKEKALLELNKEFNNKMQLQQEQFNKTIQEYQSKYRALLDDMEQIRATAHTVTKKKEVSKAPATK